MHFPGRIFRLPYAPRGGIVRLAHPSEMTSSMLAAMSKRKRSYTRWREHATTVGQSFMAPPQAMVLGDPCKQLAVILVRLQDGK